MQKYWHILKKTFAADITYRAEIFLWVVIETIPIVVMLFVWLNVYQHTTIIGSYALGDMIGYYAVAQLVSGIASVHFEQRRITEIREGKIDFFLTKPLGFLKEMFASALGSKIYYIVSSSSIAALAVFALTKLLPFTPYVFSLQTISSFVLLLAAAFCTEFLLGSIIVLTSFWLDRADGLEHFKWILVSLFGGWMMPISLMPDWLQTMTNLLPFKYLYAIPVSVLQGRYVLQLTDVAVMGSFILFLFVVAQIMWRQARYKYASAGG